MSKIKEQKPVLAKDVAIEELTEFLKKYKSKEFRRGTMSKEKIEEDYIDVIEALEDGYLTFENSKPVYKLRYPLFADAEDKSLVVENVTFRSRIKQAEKALVMDGINIEKQQGTFVLKTLSYITQLSLIEVKQLEKEDFDVLNQICSVF